MEINPDRWVANSLGSSLPLVLLSFPIVALIILRSKEEKRQPLAIGIGLLVTWIAVAIPLMVNGNIYDGGLIAQFLIPVVFSYITIFIIKKRYLAKQIKSNLNNPNS